MIEKITKFLYENNVKKINEIIDAVNALGINTPQNTASVIQQYINSLVSSVETGTANGTISLKIGETKTDVAVKGLQSAAYRSEDYFAVSSHQHVSNEINKMTGYAKPNSTSAIAVNDTLNAAIGKLERALDNKQASGSYANANHSHTEYVPTSRTVNNKALTTNITLSYSDVGAAAASHNQASNTITALPGYSKPSTTSAIAATDALNTALGKLEKALDNKLSSNDTIDKATADAAGNNIQTTYATKAELNAAQIDSSSIDLSGYAPLSHNQASNTINAMTGYVKPNTASAIAASDTLNAAIGKLEKALDNKLSDSEIAAKATADAAGNNIQTTYATKAELNAAQIDTSVVDLSGYAPLSHNQASNTIDAMTGYSKASSVAAISSSDSLNTAIGKLEKGLDGLSNKVDQSSVGNEASKIPIYSAEGHLILPSGIELF